MPSSDQGRFTHERRAVGVPDNRGAISELRRLSGLTWEEFAVVLGVARRSLHFWASGKPMNGPNRERLDRILAALRRADRGSARQNRKMLLRDHGGVIPLDLLSAKNWREFTELVGVGLGRRGLELMPLSRDVADAPRPFSPEELTGALQDPVHLGPGRLLSAAPVRPEREE